MTKKNIICILIVLTGLLALAPILAAEVSVVANPDNPVSQLSKQEAAFIFLGKLKTFPNGADVVVIDQKRGSARKEFYEKVVEKDDTKLKAYWAKRIFTGGGNPPKTVEGDAAVKDWIKAHKNGLGYISGNNVDSSVKVLLSVP